MQATRTTVWSDGQTLTAAALNGEFNNLLNAPAIANADISAGAAIVESKILFSGSGHGHTGGTDGKLIGARYGFFIPGTPSVANDLSWNPTAPITQTCTTLSAYCKIAPTGANLILQVYNITQARIVATLTITAGSQTATTSSMTNASVSANDVLRIDITQVGSTIAGSDISAILS